MTPIAMRRDQSHKERLRPAQNPGASPHSELTFVCGFEAFSDLRRPTEALVAEIKEKEMASAAGAWRGGIGRMY